MPRPRDRASIEGVQPVNTSAGGDRYAGNYWNQDWLASQGLEAAPHEAVISRFLDTGEWTGAPA